MADYHPSSLKKKLDELRKGVFFNLIETEIITKDKEKVVLFHAKPLSLEEKEVFQTFTKNELIKLCSLWGMKGYDLENTV